ncbi:MAG TPA: four helix bundle protein [Pyrinomonadaceae bacterium]|nr:four helix bundle protein [Pyrinomonadaceae bacterium]
MGGFDSHTPPPNRNFRFWIFDFGLQLELRVMTESEFKERTKGIALRIIKLVQSLPKNWIAETIGKQLLRSGTSIGANYRAACRAKSTADIINKLAIVEEEADESMFWIDLLIESEIVPQTKLEKLYNDINEIVAMTVSSIRTLKSKNLKSKIPDPKSR